MYYTNNVLKHFFKDSEIKHSILEMQQELAFIETLPQCDNLRHSRRLIKESKQNLYFVLKNLIIISKLSQN